MTINAIVSQASSEVLLQSLIDDGIRIATSIKRRIHEAKTSASAHYARALTALEYATDDSTRELLRQEPTPRGLANARTVFTGLRASAVISF